MQALSFSHHGTRNVQCGCTLYNTGSKAKLFLSCFVWFIYFGGQKKLYHCAGETSDGRRCAGETSDGRQCAAETSDGRQCAAETSDGQQRACTTARAVEPSGPPLSLAQPQANRRDSWAGDPHRTFRRSREATPSPRGDGPRRALIGLPAT
jgi:hypothetical protein